MSLSLSLSQTHTHTDGQKLSVRLVFQVMADGSSEEEEGVRIVGLI